MLRPRGGSQLGGVSRYVVFDAGLAAVRDAAEGCRTQRLKNAAKASRASSPSSLGQTPAGETAWPAVPHNGLSCAVALFARQARSAGQPAHDPRYVWRPFATARTGARLRQTPVLEVRAAPAEPASHGLTAKCNPTESVTHTDRRSGSLSRYHVILLPGARRLHSRLINR